MPMYRGRVDGVVCRIQKGLSHRVLGLTLLVSGFPGPGRGRYPVVFRMFPGVSPGSGGRGGPVWTIPPNAPIVIYRAAHRIAARKGDANGRREDFP